MTAAVLSPTAGVLALSSPRPWTYHHDPRHTIPRDWIEDANGNTVTEAVGHLDGPLICAAVNYLYEREREAEVAVAAFFKIQRIGP